MISISGAVILYYPEKSVIDNIRSYSSHVDRLYIIDNSEKADDGIVSEIVGMANVSYYHDGENKGIAARLNQAAADAINHGSEWLLTMDQDSYFTEEVITRYFDCVRRNEYHKEVAMFGVEYEIVPERISCNVNATDHLITSGSLLNLSLFEKVGKFSELLYIDEVDLEYCYRSKVAGFQILKFPDIYLKHQLGRISVHRSLKNFAYSPRTLHSPIRVYYMVRNHLYVSRHYYRFFKEDIQRSRKGLINRIKNNFLYGKTRLKLIKCLLLAIIDFRTGRMGKRM